MSIPPPPPGSPPPPPPGSSPPHPPPPHLSPGGAPPGFPSAYPPGGPPPGYPPGNLPAFAVGGAGVPGGGRPLAGFWVRFGAWLLDAILYGLLAAPFVGIGLYLVFDAFSDCVTIGDELVCPPGAPSGGSIVAGIGLMLLGAVLVFVLYVRAMATTGQPWGARMVGVKVVRSDTGAPIGLGRAIGRTLFAGFLSGQICYLGYLWAIWDGKNQTWHDKVTDSVVVTV